jgi:aminoglycoside phosphotransferase (APT) family kinase protein
VVDVSDTAAVTAMLRRYHGVPLGLLKSLIGRGLNRSRLIDVAVRDMTVVAHKPQSGDEAQEGPVVFPVDPGALVRPGRLTDAPCSTLLVTPWLEASRHVLALYIDGASADIRAVAKLPRRPWDVGGIDTEARALRAVEAHTSALGEMAPRVVGHVPGGQRPHLLQSGINGTAVDPDVVRRSTALVLDAGTTVIDRLAAVRRRPSPGWFDRLLGSPLERLGQEVPVAEVSALVAETLALLRPLQDAGLPTVLEHGDLGHPNLLLLPSGRMAAIDWERFEPRGLPCLDLVFFLQYVRECLDSATTIPAQVAAFDAGFTGPDCWAAGRLRAYAGHLHIDDAVLPQLVLASWARIVAGLVTRLEPTSGAFPPSSSGPDHVAEIVLEDRDYALWRRAVSQFGCLLR